MKFKFQFLTIMILFVSCNSYKEHYLIIDKKTFGDYPGIFLNLKDDNIIKIPNDLKKVKDGMTADLWIEPRDPEVSGLDSTFEGIKHLGQSTKIAPCRNTYESVDLKIVPNEYEFKSSLEKGQIANGKSFIVRDSNGDLYKMQIVYVDHNQQQIQLKYQLLSSPQ